MSKNVEEEDLLRTLLPDKPDDHVALSMDEDEEPIANADQVVPQRKHIIVPQNLRRHKASKKTEMHIAAELGKDKALEALVQKKPELISHQDEFCQTPLHLAAKGIHHLCCQLLLAVSTKEVNMKDKTGNTPLMLSITSGNMSLKTTKLLISKGGKVSLENKGKRTALHIAAEKGNADTLSFLLENDKSCLEGRDTEKQTPLHLAARYGHSHTCDILLLAGANTEAKDINAFTSLHWTSKQGFLHCITSLTRSKCDVNSTDNAGNTPLHLLCASGKDKPECVELLLNEGANFDAQNNKGETPFHLAQYSSFRVREMFKNRPLNLSLTDKKGRTVLHCAAERGKTSFRIDLIFSMDQLRKMNVDNFVNTLDNNGYSALHTAVINGEIETCRTLVKEGADGNIMCNGKGTALHLAAEKGFKDICDFLIAKRVKVNLKNNQSLTPLHLAAKNGHEKCCEVLIKRGAQISEINDDGNTVLHLAAEGSHVTCCELFMKTNPALVNKFNKSGRTPLHLAVEKKSFECCEVLVAKNTDIWASDFMKVPSPITLARELKFNDICINLLQQCNLHSKTQTQKDIDFREFMKEALLSSQSELVECIIRSCYWEESLQPYKDDEGEKKEEKRQNENLRHLVRTYPYLAEEVFDKCLPTEANNANEDSVKKPSEDNVAREDIVIDSSRRYKLFYIDDMSIKSNEDDKETKKHDSCLTSSYEDFFYPDCGSLKKNVKAVLVNQAWRQNHVLSCVINEGHLNLLTHPLVITWIKYKWYKYIKWIHYFFVFLALVVAVLLTTFSMEAWSWQAFSETWHLNQSSVCATGKQLVGPEVYPYLEAEAFVPNIITYALCGILSFLLLYNIYKLIMIRSRYFCAETTTFLICLASSVAFLGNYTICAIRTYIREDWQWIAGYIAIFVSWIHTYYLYSTHPTRPSPFDFSPLSDTAKRVLIPELPIVVLVIAIYGMIPKGSIALKQAFETFKGIYGNLNSLFALIIIILVVVTMIRMLRNRNVNHKLNEQRIVASVNMILDYDLMFPSLRKRLYRAWLTVEEEQNLLGCWSCTKCCRSPRNTNQSEISRVKTPKINGKRQTIEILVSNMQKDLDEIKRQLAIK